MLGTSKNIVNGRKERTEKRKEENEREQKERKEKESEREKDTVVATGKIFTKSLEVKNTFLLQITLTLKPEKDNTKKKITGQYP